MDGTFKSSSTIFYQIYILHGELQSQSFPLLYCFLNEKLKEYIKKHVIFLKLILIYEIKFRTFKSSN
jgi:hypothetical protein